MFIITIITFGTREELFIAFKVTIIIRDFVTLKYLLLWIGIFFRIFEKDGLVTSVVTVSISSTVR